MAIMNLNGDVLAQGGSFSCHDTELTNLIDDNYIVQGGEIAQPVNGINYYANVKLVSFSQTSSSTYTFTFENVQTSHTIVAASTPTPTPPNLFSTSSPISSSINYGLISVIAFVGIFLISTIVVVNRQKNKREREKLNTKAEQVEREERERAEQNENNKNKPKKKEPKKNARKLGMKPKGNLRNKI
jgi:hypothetical protein